MHPFYLFLMILEFLSSRYKSIIISFNKVRRKMTIFGISEIKYSMMIKIVDKFISLDFRQYLYYLVRASGRITSQLLLSSQLQFNHDIFIHLYKISQIPQHCCKNIETKFKNIQFKKQCTCHFLKTEK